MSPVFRHGGLRLYLLKLLDEAPRHGYDVIRLLQDRFLGVYSPSPGTIYPRLARLEAEGLVTHETVDGRKVYRITEAGRAELHRKMDDLTALEEELSASVRDIARELSQDVRETVRSLRDELTSAVREAGRPRPRRADPAQTDPAQTDPAQSEPAQSGSGRSRPDGTEASRPGDGQRESARPGAGDGEPRRPGSDGSSARQGSSRRAGGPGWGGWAGQAEQQDWRRFATWASQDWRDWARQAERDWARWAEQAQRQWHDVAGPAGWPDRDWPGWQDRVSGRGWSWWTGQPGARESGGSDGDAHSADQASDAASTVDGAAADSTATPDSTATRADGTASPADGPVTSAGDVNHSADNEPGNAGEDGPDTGHDGPDLAAELLRLAADFLRNVHRAVWQHTEALGEQSVGTLGDILTEALERIRREVFATPGSGHAGPWSASADGEQPAAGSGTEAANSPGHPSPGGLSTDESR